MKTADAPLSPCPAAASPSSFSAVSALAICHHTHTTDPHMSREEKTHHPPGTPPDTAGFELPQKAGMKEAA